MPETKIVITAVSSAAENVLRRFQGVVTGFFGQIVAAASVGALTAFSKKLIDAADNLNKMKQRVGESVEFLSTFRFIAKLADVELGELEVSLKTAAQQLANAADGGREAGAVFDSLGINAKNADGSIKSLSQLIFEVAERFKAMPDGVRKTDAAVALFGRSGHNLIPVLNQGADGLQKMQARARMFGLELSGATAEAAEQFNDNLTEMQEALRGVGERVVKEILPSLVDFSGVLLQLASDADRAEKSATGIVLVLKSMATAALAGIAAFVALTRTLVIVMAPGVNAILDAIESIPKAFDNLTSGIAESMVKIADVFKTFGTLGDAFKFLWKRQWAQAADAFDNFGSDLKAKVVEVFTGNETESPWAPIVRGLDKAKETAQHTIEEMFVGLLVEARTFKDLFDALWSTAQRRSSGTAKSTGKGGAGSASGSRAREDTLAIAGQIGRQIEDINRSMERINADPVKDHAQKKRELLPLIEEQNQLLLEQAKIYEHLRSVAKTETEKLQADQQLDQIRARRAQLGDQVRELGSATFVDQMRIGLAALSTEWGNFGANIAATALDGIRSGVQGVTDAIMGAIDGTRTWGQVFQQVGKQIIAQLISVVINWIAQKTIIEALDTLFNQKRKQKREAELPGKLLDAAAESTSSYGFAAVLGAAALGAILAFAVSAAFAQGGLVTGPGTDKSDNLLARLSPGEFVVTAPAVRKYGVDFFQNVNAGIATVYDAMNARAGGIARPATADAGFGAAGAPVNVSPAPVHIINVYNEQDLLRVLQSRAGEQIVIQHVSNNKNQLGIRS